MSCAQVFYSLVLRSNTGQPWSALLAQQQMAAISDRELGGLRKSLQQPRQRHFQPDMIVVDFQYRNAGGGARQSDLEAARCLLAAEAMRNRNDKRSGHLRNPQADRT